MDVLLNDGTQMPALGLGTYLSEAAHVGQAVLAALDAGYRRIDTASFYRNEAEIGQALARSGVPRDEVFITTKVWNDDQGFEETLTALRRSLDRLGLDYVDLYLVHWPRPILMEETWRAMELLHSDGRARSIGVSNFLPHHLDRLASFADTMPVLNQVEFHPHLQSPDLVASCEQHEVVAEAWSPLKRGRVFDDPVIAGISSAHGVSPAQVVIRWVLQRGLAVIPKSINAHRIKSNFDVFGFSLTAEEMMAIDGMDQDDRIGPHPDLFPG